MHIYMHINYQITRILVYIYIYSILFKLATICSKYSLSKTLKRKHFLMLCRISGELLSTCELGGLDSILDRSVWYLCWKNWH